MIHSMPILMPLEMYLEILGDLFRIGSELLPEDKDLTVCQVLSEGKTESIKPSTATFLGHHKCPHLLSCTFRLFNCLYRQPQLMLTALLISVLPHILNENM